MHRRDQSNTSTVRQKRGPKRGVRFNIMIAGAGGTGKSTFINTLVGKQLVSTSDWLDQDPSTAGRERAVRLRTFTDELPDADLGPITLRLIETTGFGDNLDATAGLREIVAYIESQFDEVLAEETRIRRNPRFTDNRIHALIYFIEPTGHGLRETDVEFMRLVGPRVNVIPVLAKADSLTKSERVLNKTLIREDFDRYAVPVYQFSNLEGSDVEDAAAATASEIVQEALPFALVSANTTVNTQDGRSVPARRYPWGEVIVEDPKVSDFALLRDVLLYSHLNELKEATEDFLYENYRTQRLSQGRGSANDSGVANTSTASADITSFNESYDDRDGHRPTLAHIAREEQLRQEESQLHKSEADLQQQLEQKRLELERREQELRDLEARLRKEAQTINSPAFDEGTFEQQGQAA